MIPTLKAWRSLGRSADAAKSAPRTGWVALLSSTLVHLPENAAYGVVALAPLGLAYGPTAMALALAGAVVANALASLLGDGRLVGGPRASFALLTAAFAAALIQRLADSGSGSPAVVMALLAMGLIAAGALQVSFGVLRLGGIVKFTPYPVRVGLSSGIGLLLVASALPVLMGHGFGASWSAVTQPVVTGALLVGLASLGVAWWASWRRVRVPPVLLGLAAGVAVHAALSAAWPELGALRMLGSPAWPAGGPPAWGALSTLPAVLLERGVLLLVGSYSLTVAVLASLDTLLASSVIDGRLRSSRDPNRELMAQGLANCASALIGGQPASPSVPRSLMLLGAQGGRRHIVLTYALASLVLAALAPPLLGLLPDSAVGGVLVAQGLLMLSGSLWRTPLELWARRTNAGDAPRYDDGQRRMLMANWAVAVAVALNAVVLGLGPAVLIGASFAVLLFVRANMRDVVRRQWSGQTRRSLKMRPQAVSELLRREGERIALLELEGSLFFGTADALRVRLQALPPQVETAILDLHQINEIDVTAGRILLEAAEDWAQAGRRMVFAEWPAGDARRRVVETVATAGTAGTLQFADHTDAALERAEDALLARIGAGTGDDAVLPLSQTMIARGLDPDELECLAAELQTVEFSRGQVMFRVGDPGDAIYISVKGEIGLRIPGSTRRLASFAPGVTIGEMAVLAHATRSAEAVAESDVTALMLPVSTFDRLKTEHPGLASKLLTNIALHLADRVRVLTGDLAHWVSRAAAGRTAPQVVAERVRAAEDEEVG